MPLPEIEEIFKKFKNEEEKVEKLLIERSDTETIIKSSQLKKNEFLTLPEVKERNKKLINDLEAAKGRLRSKSIFCPTEVQLENICMKYKETPSLPVTRRKCQIPVFV